MFFIVNFLLAALVASSSALRLPLQSSRAFTCTLKLTGRNFETTELSTFFSDLQQDKQKQDATLLEEDRRAGIRGGITSPAYNALKELSVFTDLQQNVGEPQEQPQLVEDKAPLVWKLCMLFICICWGTNFAVIRQIFNEVPGLDPVVYASLRFGIAAVALLPTIVPDLVKGLSPRTANIVKESFIVGFFVFLGYIGQSIGIAAGSTAEKSAFICSLSVVWVPLVQSVRSRNFQQQNWLSTFLAISGIALLELRGSQGPNVGDLWSLLQPVGFGTSYILLESFSKRQAAEVLEPRIKSEQTPSAEASHVDAHAGLSSGMQVLCIALLSTVYAVATGHTLADFAVVLDSPTAGAGLAYTGLVTTAFCICLQTLASSRVKATDAALILAWEPVVATAFAAWLLHERVTPTDIAGAILITLASLNNDAGSFNIVMNKFWSIISDKGK